MTRVSGSTSSPVLRGAVSSGSAARSPPDPASPGNPGVSPHLRHSDHPDRRRAARACSPLYSPRLLEDRVCGGPPACLAAYRSSSPSLSLLAGLSSAAFPRSLPHPDSTLPGPATHPLCFRASPKITRFYTKGQKYGFFGVPGLYDGPYASDPRIHIIAGTLWHGIRRSVTKRPRYVVC